MRFHKGWRLNLQEWGFGFVMNFETDPDAFVYIEGWFGPLMGHLTICIGECVHA